MKKLNHLHIAIIFIFLSGSLQAQWTTYSPTTVGLNTANKNRNLGIGTTLAGAKLHVEGTTLLNGNTTIGGDLFYRGSKLDLSLQNALSIQNLTLTGNRINYTGTALEFYTPVQAQYNGNKPVLSMSQYGEINFFSSPFLNYNSILLKGTGDYKNGLSFADSFGTTTGIAGAVLFGENGGALGSRLGIGSGEKVALRWDANNNVTLGGKLIFADGSVQTTAGGAFAIQNNYNTYAGSVNIQGTLKLGTSSLFLGSTTTGAAGTQNYIYTDNAPLVLQNTSYNIGIGNVTSPTEKVEIAGNIKFKNASTGIKFADNSTLSSANGLLRNGSNNVSFGSSIEVTGDNPAVRIGGLVMQDFSKFTYSTISSGDLDPSTVSSINFTTILGLGTPESFVFGNIAYVEATQKYTSIYNTDDYTKNIFVSAHGSQKKDTTVLLQKWSNRNGGTSIRFNSDEGAIEFIGVPSVAGTNTGWSLTKQELLARRHMVINANGNVGIGTATPAEKLDVIGNIKANGIRIGNGPVITDLASSQWKTNTNNDISFNGGKVGIGTATPALMLDIVTTAAGWVQKISGNASDSDNPAKSFVGIKIDNIWGWVGIAAVVDGSYNPGLGLSVGQTEGLRIIGNGNVGIGNAVPTAKLHVNGNVIIGNAPRSSMTDYKLSVDGKIIATELSLNIGYWPDDVFEPTYKLTSIADLEAYILKNKHLPDVPTATHMKANGVNTAEMLQIQMKKIEELTLMLIQQNKEIETLKKQVNPKN